MSRQKVERREKGLNKREFVREIARRRGVSEYAVSEIYNVSSELIAETLIQEDHVELPKLGVFALHTKMAKNLFGEKKNQTGLCIYPSFRICERLKGRIKDGCRYQKALDSRERKNVYETELF